MTMCERLRLFDYRKVAREFARADPAETILCADSGWRMLWKRAPRLATIARAVQDDPTILTAPVAATPVTFLHGDWKMGCHAAWPYNVTSSMATDMERMVAA
jgi:hypothetical protein